ncbi:hypothetical protein RHECNPAF_122100128 [Rhizobium etli CNPAF512]|nr:hypothetical protein RHECNPAF_122100128 [Rhizobium etli CNPAF512]
MRSGLPGTGTGTTQWFRKTWRKLHLCRGNILTSEPTTEHVGDETVAARSSRTCRRTGWSTDFRSPDGCFRIRSPCQVCQRNQHIEPVAEHCRIAWQAAVGDNQRSGIAGSPSSAAGGMPRTPKSKPSKSTAASAGPNVSLRAGKLRTRQGLIRRL